MTCGWCGVECDGRKRKWCSNTCKTNAWARTHPERRAAILKKCKSDPVHRQRYQKKTSQWRADNIEKVRAYNRTAAISRKRREPEKVAARKAVERALVSGTLHKPSWCWMCRQPTVSRRLHGHHHWGYDRPLDVVWLCAPCHRTKHPRKEVAA